MPRGFSGVRQASADIESRRGGSGPNALWFRLAAGDETTVRFLEQDDEIFYAMMHEVPVEGRQFGRDVVCLDQEREGIPCPGCEKDLRRYFKGYINVIWEDAPVFKRDSEGKLVRGDDKKPVQIGTKAQVAIWSSGIRLFEDLDEINANYRGLTSRRFRVKRKGEKLNTKYVITPENVDEGAQALTNNESDLAKNKYDLTEYTKPGTYEEFLKELGEHQHGGGGEGENGSGGINPFMRNRS